MREAAQAVAMHGGLSQFSYGDRDLLVNATVHVHCWRLLLVSASDLICKFLYYLSLAPVSRQIAGRLHDDTMIRSVCPP
jgi:hypothetical protein